MNDEPIRDVKELISNVSWVRDLDGRVALVKGIDVGANLVITVKFYGDSIATKVNSSPERFQNISRPNGV